MATITGRPGKGGYIGDPNNGLPTMTIHGPIILGKGIVMEPRANWVRFRRITLAERYLLFKSRLRRRMRGIKGYEGFGYDDRMPESVFGD